MSDEKKTGKVILTSTPSFEDSGGWLYDLFKDQSLSEVFRREYQADFKGDPFSKMGKSMDETADAFKLLGGAMTSAATATAPTTFGPAERDKLMDAMKAASAKLEPAPMSRGTRRIAEAMRAEKEAKQKAALDQIKAMRTDDDLPPGQEPEPHREIDRGTEWGSW